MYALSAVERFRMRGVDADLGRVEDAYVDDRHWVVRHLVVDSHHWLRGRRVLIPPAAVRAVDDTHQRIEIALTRGQVEQSPPVDTAKPVSFQHHVDLYSYFGFPYAWTGSAVHRDPLAGLGGGDPYLRSARAMTGYHVRATNGEAGRIDDFLVEGPSWTVRYVVVRSGHGWGGPHALLSPGWITRVSWEGRLVEVQVTREALQRAPRYDPARPLDRAYEARLRAYYATLGRRAGDERGDLTRRSPLVRRPAR